MRFLFFPSFFDKPQKISFVDQEPSEKIELFLRQHWITNLPWVIGSTIAFAFPSIVIFLDRTLMFNLVKGMPSMIYIQLLVLYYMLIIAYIIEKFLYWYFNIYIVTNTHVVDIDFYSLMSRDLTEIDIKNIQSVSSKFRGVIGPFFNFGDVDIETAAKDQNAVFEKVPNPDVVADRISDLKGKTSGNGI